jgi:hypothetical protein
MARKRSSGSGGFPPPHDNCTAETVIADYNSLGRYDKDLVIICFRIQYAEGAVELINEMSQQERQRLGMLLSREIDVLPGWRVIPMKSSGHVWGLTDNQARLYNYLAQARQPQQDRDYGRRERDVVRHLWPAEAASGPNPARNVRLQARLRKLQHDANKNLARQDFAQRIMRKNGLLRLVPA